MKKEIKKEPLAVGEILKSFITEKEPYLAASLIPWENAVGKTIARISWPISLKGKTLFVAVESPSWASELNLLQKQVVRKINQEIGKEIIREIKIVPGKVPKKDSGPRNFQ